MNPVVWRLKKGSEKKFRSGHPWVFSNELAQSPKGLPAGAQVELRDYNDGFLARGYGHPNSLISFRTLTRNRSQEINIDFLLRSLRRASSVRRLAQVHQFSHRLCFAEADGLPGLVIDRYRLLEGRSKASERVRASAQVFVVQSSTAGMDLLLPLLFEALERWVREEHQADALEPGWEQTSIVVANDSKSRAMENIPVEPKKVLRAASGFQADSAHVLVQPGVTGLEPLCFEVDFIGGQKTGFFLDQRLNVHLASQIAQEIMRTGKSEVRILDLCCYVGQWGTQMAHLARHLGVKAEVTLLDASARALDLASRNVENHGGEARPEKRDVLEDIASLPKRGYDIVICDPPAFIKKKKDLPTGGAAYYKLNREALRRTAHGGLYVSCSCSGLFTEEDFRSMLARVVATHDTEVRWIVRGSHSPDHPQRPEFPQGTYLKSWMGVVLDYESL